MDTDQIKGKLQNAFGKVEEAVGEAIGSQNLTNAGTEDRVKGAAVETWGNAKDAVHHVGDTANRSTDTTDSSIPRDGESLRDRIADGTERIRDAIGAKTDEVKARDANRSF